MSSFGFGGANVHLVMEGTARSRCNLLVQKDIYNSGDANVAPYAIPLAARSAAGLDYLVEVIHKVALVAQPELYLCVTVSAGT